MAQASYLTQRLLAHSLGDQLVAEPVDDSDQLTAVVSREADVCVVGPIYLVVFVKGVLGHSRELFDVVVANHAVLATSDEAQRQVGLLNGLASLFLFFNP